LSADAASQAYTAWDEVDIAPQVEGLIGLTFRVTRHTLLEVSCSCGHVSRAQPWRAPADGQWEKVDLGEWRLVGPRLAGVIVLLALRMRLSRASIRELLMEMFESVNTAAERIRKHCGRLGTSLEVVRFSNREGAVSHGLKDVYSHAITAEKRELFNAEYRYRVAALSDALGLDAEFISKVVEAELKLFKQIDHLEFLLKNFENVGDEDDIKALKPIVVELDENIRTKLHTDYGIALSRKARFRMRSPSCFPISAPSMASVQMKPKGFGRWLGYPETSRTPCRRRGSIATSSTPGRDNWLQAHASVSDKDISVFTTTSMIS
jgi:hypothetical protein